MTNPKDHDKDSAEDDWHFSNVKINIKHDDVQASTKFKKNRNAKELRLDIGPARRVKTRSALAMELNELNEADSEDVYSLAPFAKRGFAFVIDSFFLIGLLYIVKDLALLLRSLIQFFLDKYSLQFIIPESVVMKIIIAISGFGLLFFFVVLPVAFYNHSLGKKIFGLKLRGENRYTLSILQVLKRELILKPISIAIIAGIITPFYSKKRLSVHDMIAHTFVVVDD